MQWSESVVCIHPSPPSWASLPLAPILPLWVVMDTKLSSLWCRQLPTSYPSHTREWIYGSGAFSIHPTSSFPLPAPTSAALACWVRRLKEFVESRNKSLISGIRAPRLRALCENIQRTRVDIVTLFVCTYTFPLLFYSTPKPSWVQSSFFTTIRKGKPLFQGFVSSSAPVS